MEKLKKVTGLWNVRHKWPSSKLPLEIIKTNILSKIHDDHLKNVISRVLKRFSFDLAWWPNFWLQVTQFWTRCRNHQEEHLEYSWWLFKQEGQDGPVSLTWLPDKSESIGLSVQKKKLNTDFQAGGHHGFPIRMILASFYLPVTSILPMKFQSIALLVQEKKFKMDLQHFNTPILPIKFRVSGPFYSGEVQNRFSRWQLWRQSCISDRNDFSYFWSTSQLDDFYQVSSQLAFWFRRRSEK